MARNSRVIFSPVTDKRVLAKYYEEIYEALFLSPHMDSSYDSVLSKDTVDNKDNVLSSVDNVHNRDSGVDRDDYVDVKVKCNHDAGYDNVLSVDDNIRCNHVDTVDSKYIDYNDDSGVKSNDKVDSEQGHKCMVYSRDSVVIKDGSVDSYDSNLNNERSSITQHVIPPA